MYTFHYPTYSPHSEAGILTAGSRGNGSVMAISWNRAYPDSSLFNLGYNIYYSTVKEDVFSEGVKFVIDTSTTLSLEITDLTPGDTYYFAVRAFQYDPALYSLSYLPDVGVAKAYSDGMLLSNISATDGYVPVSDLELFPPFGVVKVGAELIKYTNKDLATQSLVGLTRGFLDTNIRFHQTDGYDGYYYQDPIVHFWSGFEDKNTNFIAATCDFTYPNFPGTLNDGYYKVTKDILTTDLSASDASQADFPRYDYVGWHRTNPIALFNGDCIGTYIGGEQYCADGYGGVGRMVRGMPLQSVSHQRQELLLSMTGEPCVLVSKMRTGIRCSCYLSTTQYAEDRCPICSGSGFVSGYKQYFNSRRSDGRILVRFEPTEDDLKLEDAGLESVFNPSCWTLVTPILKDRDFIIRFNEDGTEEFRYEVLSVTRNKLMQSFSGVQKFRAQRVRKTDPIYHFRYTKDTSTIPRTLNTSIGFTAGLIAPHYHTFVTSEKVNSITEINQYTSVAADHNHVIKNGVVQEALGHTHTIALI